MCVFVIKAMKMATTTMTAERKTKWQNKLKEKQIKINEKGCKSGGKKIEEAEEKGRPRVRVRVREENCSAVASKY